MMLKLNRTELLLLITPGSWRDAGSPLRCSFFTTEFDIMIPTIPVSLRPRVPFAGALVALRLINDRR